MKQPLYYLFFLITLSLMISCSEQTTEPHFNGWYGSGTETDPYQISHHQHLKALADSVNSGISYENQFFVLTSDISLAEYQEGEGWEPIGNVYYEEEVITGQEIDLDMLSEDLLDMRGWEVNAFQASFDGNGHSISDLYIAREDESYQGLFGIIIDANIKNLRLENIEIYTNMHYVGALAGRAESSQLSDICSNGDVNGALQVGGLVGIIVESTISNSCSKGTVDGFSGVGGLIGGCFISEINYSYSNSDVTGDQMFIGGLSGIIDSSTTQSCYSTGSVDGSWCMGGLAGAINESHVINSYSKGEVNLDPDHGGLIAANTESKVIDSYWNIETSGQSISAGGEGRTTNEMTYPYADNTYVDWDFDEIWVEDIHYEVNNGYPYFYWE